MTLPTTQPVRSELDADSVSEAPVDRPAPAPSLTPLRPVSPQPGETIAVAEAPAIKVDLRKINFFYNQTQALRDISLPLYDRRVTAFIGPSGCGKSTLLRTLNRIYQLYPGQVATGEVMVDGINILAPGVDLNLVRAKIGMVFQKPTPFPMSIHDNVAFGIRLYEKLPKSELDDRIESALRRAALWDEVKDKLRQSGLSLSGGQQQRLCIARAIAVQPEVLLLDEPASALDPISTQRIEELIAELKADYCIAIVTHNMQQAARSSDYTAFMYLGELIEFDETERIFTHPSVRAPKTTSPAASADGRTSMAAEHIVKSYDEELERLNNMIVEMGGLAESQLAAAIEAVIDRDSDLRHPGRRGRCRRSTQLERDLDNLAIRLLALRQPMARDLREIVAALKIASDLERICDYAANVAKRSIALAQAPPIQPVHALPRMAHLALLLVKDVIDAYVARDADKALAVWLRDEELDDMYASLFREFLTYMMEDPRNIGACTHLLFMAKNIERSATTRPTSPRTCTTWCMASRSPRRGRKATSRASKSSRRSARPARPQRDEAARADRRGRGAARHDAALQPRTRGLRGR